MLQAHCGSRCQPSSDSDIVESLQVFAAHGFVLASSSGHTGLREHVCAC